MRRTLDIMFMVILSLTMLGSMVLFQTDSRSSILIKEAAYVTGAVLALLAGAFSMAATGRLAAKRVSVPLVISFMLLMLWLVFRHYHGIQSVNGPKYMYSTLSLGALAFIAALHLTHRTRNILLWILVAATALLSVYALLQSAGVSRFSWDAGIMRSARSSGTMGNANLLGSFSMAMIPVGTGFLLSRLKLSRFRYILAGVFAFLCLGALLVSKTRGSLLGIIAIAAAVPFIPEIRRNWRRFAVIMLVILVFMGISVLALRNRVMELADTDEGTLQVRNLIWSGSIAMWLDNPVLGNGPGSFQMVFPQFRDPEYFLRGVSHNTLHAHCEYLEILGDTGIIGMILWISVALSAAVIIRRHRKSVFPEDGGAGHISRQWIALGLAGGILALLAEALVSVALRWPPSAMLLSFLTGLLLSFVPAGDVTLQGLKRTAPAVLMTALAVFLAVFAVPEYLRSMKAGKELFTGKDIYLTNIQPGIDNAVSASIEWSSTGSLQSMERAVEYFLNAMALADSSVKWCERCVRTDPGELGGWYALGSAYVTSARLYQQISPPLTAILMNTGMDYQDPDRAHSLMLMSLAVYDSLRNRAPDYAEVHNNLSLVWINLGNADSALSHMRRSWDLHAHNRIAYAGKLQILSPLTRSLDGVYMKWQLAVYSIERAIGADRITEPLIRLHDAMIFDFGTTFLQFPQQAESLRTELAEALAAYDHPEARRMEDITGLQLTYLDESIPLAEQFQAGDTAGVMARLEDIDPETVQLLPVHRAVLSLILARSGDPLGMEMLCRTVECILWNGIDDLADFPVSVTDMLEQMNGALYRSGIDTPEERSLLYRHLNCMLRLDRSIFEVIIFIESSHALEEASQDIEEDYRLIWERIGGPLFTFMEYRDEEAIPVIAPGSIMDAGYHDLRELVAEDSLSADLALTEIEWLFILFSSSYKGIPHYSTRQSGMLVSMISDARERLVEIIGESEAQYRLGRMLNLLFDSHVLNFSGEFSGYVEALRSDLIMGRITRPDLP